MAKNIGDSMSLPVFSLAQCLIISSSKASQMIVAKCWIMFFRLLIYGGVILAPDPLVEAHRPALEIEFE